jgi:hypothetical protein
MSPSEFDLRAALRDGEGDGIDPGTVIFRARALRHQRRVRFASAAAVVAVVAGIGVGGGVVLTGGGAGSSGSLESRATGKAGRAGGSGQSGSAGYDANGPSAPAGSARVTAVACPAALPQLAAPASGGGGSLFAGTVAAVKICAYPEASGPPITDAKGEPVTAALTGAQATALAASLDAADRTRQAGVCPQYRSADGKTLVIIGIAADGAAMPPVTAVVAQNPCNSPVTNGTAVRYNWTPPAYLAGYLGQVQAAGAARARSLSPSGKVIPPPPTR